jgi:DNA-binding NtrC family response regulator
MRSPPLRERREDIPLLVRHFTRPGAKGTGLVFEGGAITALQRYDFPGNIRELQNVIERIAILHAGETIDASHVQAMLTVDGKSRGARGSLYQFGALLKDLMHDLERQVLVEAIAANGNSKSAAAAALGTERSHFYKKCRQYSISGQEG